MSLKEKTRTSSATVVAAKGTQVGNNILLLALCNLLEVKQYIKEKG